jgi:hypothetical protein
MGHVMNAYNQLEPIQNKQNFHSPSVKTQKHGSNSVTYLTEL